MSAPANLADRVGERLSGLEAPWDVYAERSRRFEIHLTGSRVALTRGPIRLEGYGVRVIRKADGQVGVGFQSSTVFSKEGIGTAVEDAEQFSRFNRFPAKSVELPDRRPAMNGGPKVVDPTLWSDPMGSLQRFAEVLVDSVGERKGAALTFGSALVTLSESSVANSTGLSVAYPHTVVELEAAVKASGGPEGQPPGEHWFISIGRRLPVEAVPGMTARWSRFAEDARHAKPPPNGARPVALPPEVLEGIVPPVVRFRFGAVAKLRGLGVAPDTPVASAGNDLLDDGLLDWAVGAAPVDDEGAPHGRHLLVSNGKAKEVLADSLYASAVGVPATGSAGRVAAGMGTRMAWGRYTRPPAPYSSTVVIPPGKGGDDAELVEQVDDGIWVQQIGWPQPDPVSGRFGGEIRLGYRIRHGKIAEPVRGGTVGGFVLRGEDSPSLLHDLTAVGSRSMLVGELSSPTLLVRSLTVAGDEAGRSP